jgi:hypothetical protein
VQTVEVRKIARLVDLVDIRLFGREVDVFANLVADIAEQRIVDEVLNYGVFVAIESIRQSRKKH